MLTTQTTQQPPRQALLPALYCKGQYLTMVQRGDMRRAFDDGCSLITRWMSSVLAGSGDTSPSATRGEAGTITTHTTERGAGSGVGGERKARILNSLLTYFYILTAPEEGRRPRRVCQCQREAPTTHM